MSDVINIEAALNECPIIAILRGIRSADAVGIVEALYAAGIRVAEVPLNSPEPFITIRLLRDHFEARMIIGAGTVTEPCQVEELAHARGQICVSPNANPLVISACLKHDIIPVPGFATASEAFTAISAGATILKLFPAGGSSADFVRALKAVLPTNIRIVAVGGVSEATMADLAAAGCGGFGVGSDLFRPGRSVTDVSIRARKLVTAASSAPFIPMCTAIAQVEAVIAESPIIVSNRISWVDPVTRKLYRHSAEEGSIDALDLSQPISAIAMVQDRLLGIAETDFYEIDQTNGQCISFARTDALGAGCRLNDLALDDRGGYWAGSMHKELLSGHGKLVHVDASGKCRTVFEGLGVCNGMAFDAAGTTLFVIDTLARNLLAFPADTAAGVIGEPIIVTDFLGIPGKPDGLAIAPDGKIWVAMWGGSCIVEIGRDGIAHRRVAIPAPHVSSLCFDPVATAKCYVTTSRMRLSPSQISQFPLSGSLFAIDLVRGTE